MKLESIFALFFSIAGTILFTLLLVNDIIGSISYITLLSILALVCLVLHGFSRIREFDLKNLRMTLSRIEKVKAEVYAKEKDLKNISISLARIIAFNNAFQGRWGSEEGNKLKRNWYRLQTDSLLKTLVVDDEIKKDILKYDEFFQQINDHADIHEKEKMRDELYKLIESDLQKSEK